VQGKGFSVSVASVGQMLKMGVAADFGLCKGKRKDGVACTMEINKYVSPQSCGNMSYHLSRSFTVIKLRKLSKHIAHNSDEKLF